MTQHICLCRNEDIVLPDAEAGIVEMSEEAFTNLHGFELEYNIDNPTEKITDGFPVGHHRYIEGHPITYGRLSINI